ncbi:ABC transporter ATP-binding protein [Rhodovibrionaceae bacterium A322]
MAQLTLTHVDKAFGDFLALQSITAQIEDGEFVALLGPSGCGKTTLLRLLAGFEMPTRGSIQIAGQDVAHADKGTMIPPEARNLGIVFQSYALWPHMTVTQNIAFPLEMRGQPRDIRESRTQAALAATELTAYAERTPAELSGGQRQRVALARCLVCDTTAVLLDEPLANLDVALRASMQEIFSDFHQRTGATMVYVTHDQAEAMAMADRIAVMSDGKIVQFDRPEALYSRPRSAFVADFVGEGAVVPVTPLGQEAPGRVRVRLLGFDTTVESDSPQPSLACLRPENLTIVKQGSLRAKVSRSTYLGGRFRLSLKTSCGTDLVTESRTRYPEGTQLGLNLSQPWAFADA